MATSRNEKETRVLLFGLGAIGGFYAFILANNPNVSLSVVARSNYESVKTNGLKIESQNHGTHQVRIEQVLKSPADAGTTFDYIVCAHKAVDPAKVPPILKPAVSDSTTFVIIQNGVGNEEPFRTTFPENAIISCVTWVGASQTEPGVVKHTKVEDMQIGLFPSPHPDRDEERLNDFASLLRNGGTVFQVEKNIQTKRWEKVVWNAAWNPITTLTDVNTQVWLETDEATSVTKRLMREVIDVAKRCGVPIEYELADTLIDKIQAMSGIFSSMHGDSKANNPLEVDVILGYPMKKAKEFGMDTPTLSVIYALTMAVNGRIVRSKM